MRWPWPLNARSIRDAEFTVAGSLGYDRTGPHDDDADTIHLLAKYREQIAPLVTHTYPPAAV